MWGLTTLGETPQTQKGFEIVQGDHSIFLLIEGILFLISFILFLWFYYINIRDAYKVASKQEEGIKPNNTKEMFKNIWENGFPYILLTPICTIYFIFNSFAITIRYPNSIYKLFGSKLFATQKFSRLGRI